MHSKNASSVPGNVPGSRPKISSSSADQVTFLATRSQTQLPMPEALRRPSMGLVPTSWRAEVSGLPLVPAFGLDAPRMDLLPKVIFRLAEALNSSTLHDQLK